MYEQKDLPGIALEVEIPTQEKVIELPPQSYRCINCKQVLTEEGIQKQPLDFIKDTEGKLIPDLRRYSVFCKKCQAFLQIIDPDVSCYLRNNM